MSDADTVPSADHSHEIHDIREIEHMEHIEGVPEESRGGRRRAPKKGGVYSEIQDLRSRLDEQQASLEAIKSAFNAVAFSLNGRQVGNNSNNINNMNNINNVGASQGNNDNNDAELMRRLFSPMQEERLGRRYDGGNNNPRYRNNNSFGNSTRGGYGQRWNQRNSTNRTAAFD